MVKNVLKLAIRTLFKKKIFSFINILGLAVGMAACLIILQYVFFEVGYDRFHPSGENIYRVVTQTHSKGETSDPSSYTYHAMAPALADEFKEVEAFSRFHVDWGGSVVTYEQPAGTIERFKEDEIIYVDHTFFSMFNFPATAGDPNTFLSEPNSILLTEKMVEKYYGSADYDAIGKTLQLNGGWAEGDFLITGILQDIPENSQFKFDFVVSMEKLLQSNQYQQSDGWGWSNFNIYVLLNPNVDVESFEAKLPQLVEKYRGENLADNNQESILSLEPFYDIHLYSAVNDDVDVLDKSNSDNVYFFALIAVFILLIAWVNYINLSTARSVERAKEVGVKKSMGANRKQLIAQFLSESVLVNLIALALAVFLAFLALPVLRDLTGKSLTLNIFNESSAATILIATFGLGTLLSGLYPAFVLSSHRAISVLRGKYSGSSSGLLLRKGLVVFQFACSMVLIAGTFAVYSQIKYMQSQKLGLNIDQVLVVEGPSIIGSGDEFRASLNSFKTELLREPAIQHVASSTNVPGGGFNWGTEMRRDGTDRSENKSGNVSWIDKDFIDTYQLELISGQDYQELSPEGGNGVIINEKAVEVFGLGDPQEALTHNLIVSGDTIRVRGVMKNYHWNSLQSDFVPVLLAPTRGTTNKFSVKLQSDDLQQTIAAVEKWYKEIFPGNPFTYYFADDFFNKQYQADNQFGQIFGVFASLAILVACLGLFGLASFTAVQRTKEIGVRKVLGASVFSVLLLLSKYFLILIAVAAVVATPLIYFGLDSWLDNYAFRIAIGLELFALPALALMAIAILTVSYHSLSAARLSPARSLRSE